MKKWLKERTRQEKVMMTIIILLLIAIGFRWQWVKKEAGDAIRYRVERTETPTVESLIAPDDQASDE